MSDDADLFLPRDPPPFVARLVAVVVLGASALALVAVFAVPMPETVGAPFAIVPLQAAEPLRSPVDGVVSGVPVAEGDVVGERAPLVVVRSEDVGDRAAELARLEARTADAGARTAVRAEGHRAALEAGERALDALRVRGRWLARALVHLEADDAAAHADAAEARRLAASGAVSEKEAREEDRQADAAALALAQGRLDLEENRARQAEAEAALAQRRADQAEADRAADDELAADRARIGLLRSDPGTRAGNTVTLEAPCAGVVVKLTAQRAGVTVAAGDTLAEVACGGEAVRARVRIPEEGSARVAPGQRVKLYFDAFPYQRYGVRWGTTERTSPVVSLVDGTPIREITVRLDPPGGAGDGALPVLQGMGGRAEVVVGRRTLFGHLLQTLHGPAAWIAASGPAPPP